MASVLRHVKAIKLSAYENAIAKTALALREHEITCMIKCVRESLKVAIVTNYNSNFLSLITIMTYTLVSLFGDGGISTSKIFATVTTIALISTPLLMLGQQLGRIVSAWASWRRIEEFLLSEEKVSEVHGSSSGIELVDKGSPSIQISLSEASFGVKGKEAFLHDVDVELAAPPLWMIVGRVGSVSVPLHLARSADIIVGKVGATPITLGGVGCTERIRTMSTRLDWILLARSLALESLDSGKYHLHVPLRTSVVP